MSAHNCLILGFMYFFYMLRCGDGSLYCGQTNNLEKRIHDHSEGIGSRYTRAHLPVVLVYSEPCKTLSEALKREYEVKQWSKAKKEALIKRV